METNEKRIIQNILEKLTDQNIKDIANGFSPSIKLTAEEILFLKRKREQ